MCVCVCLCVNGHNYYIDVLRDCFPHWTKFRPASMINLSLLQQGRDVILYLTLEAINGYSI